MVLHIQRSSGPAEWLIEGEPPLELATDASNTVRPIWTSVPGKHQAILTIHDAAGTWWIRGAIRSKVSRTRFPSWNC